ncbi:Transcriptional activator NphR [Falsiruegeria litorea R37]|uniref:Transcriptional activator NphR n=1 Tax=Falsiruegeria litorea R37 TaxID=1200284 RepID=A0A1Y5S2Y3_9RHOB|nr:helix-turn-helix domain-containing protein [Falsiruegeria litorea]SLN31469.1 Transcriptional activator NphR [Falsiruegeria litorea R37]
MLEGEEADDETSSTPLAHSHFSVRDLPRRHRFEEWRESISCVFEVEAASDVRQENFKASVDGHLLDTVMLAETSSRQQTWHRSPQRIAADGMDHYMIQLFSDGNMATDQGDNAGVSPKGGLVVFDLSREAKSATNDFTNVSLILPREMVAPFLQAPDDQHLRYLSPKEPLVRLLHNQIATLRSVAPDMTTAQAVEVVPHVAGLVSACLNGTVHGAHSTKAGIPLATITLVKKIIEARLGDNRLSPAEIARHAGVSRSRLYEIFESYGGVAKYIRTRRLRAVARQLADPALAHRPIYDVALACGFENAPAFARAFRTRFDQSPREYRENAKALRRVDLSRRDTVENYEAWLHQL